MKNDDPTKMPLKDGFAEVVTRVCKLERQLTAEHDNIYDLFDRIDLLAEYLGVELESGRRFVKRREDK